ncbi:diacylglycerol kinase [Tepidiphilus sp. B18-69]|uniref:Diacylglycerol kinase n=2 Tax=Tepidiphilus baoligensis TaxID=2698687 RepID=A0ABX1QKU7_9PROT|nr:diacylglycerol kinase [Tepidiphilus baoligensis]
MAFRQEVLVFVMTVPLALLLGRTSVERALLVAATLVVLVVELLNSAIEAVCDLVHPEAHPLVARAKDLGSAAVLLSIACAALVWGGVLWLRFVGG